MLNRTHTPSPRVRRLLPLLGAVVTLIFCFGLVATGVGLAIEGCECGSALGPTWLWFALLGLGVTSGALGVALLWRYIEQIRRQN